MALIDSHIHLDMPAFDTDREAVCRRAGEAGIRAMVVPATSASTWPRVHALCNRMPHLYPAYGLHPYFTQEHRHAHLGALDEWLDTHQAVAIGECGLDWFIDHPQPDLQRRYFHGQIELARRHDLPLIMHARRAEEEVLQTLRKTSNVRGVVHSFAGSEEQARQLWQLGIHIGLGGPLTYDRARRLHRVVASMPLEQLLLETDAPDQPGSGHQGERNEPCWLGEVAHAVARIRDEDPATIARATCANARRLFGLPDLDVSEAAPAGERVHQD
ncbi:TatD family hydrolase [Oleiagrimonas sp. C23AA]|uniref:TatD family hydrolase n=1 Tax=Oleiagrimonas sp. C23AA TaxID=2719047 RepID=UPI0014238969|nr:TatD family hydrolase [Oleiagrimonas sp. C23AA]NII09632.1 TatD family hydrolase [Oleiagrimonas sp. C23AA]